MDSARSEVDFDVWAGHSFLTAQTGGGVANIHFISTSLHLQMPPDTSYHRESSQNHQENALMTDPGRGPLRHTMSHSSWIPFVPYSGFVPYCQIRPEDSECSESGSPTTRKLVSWPLGKDKTHTFENGHQGTAVRRGR
jgi:hypothetical protein